ncbi:hypothetical protein [Nonomuraea sp. JJY05]|uniref:hypothetical protein n=1 Tax=Nonomuraea sp. JJY05 TaxID=3350255 RepID=UPI00373F6FA7
MIHSISLRRPAVADDCPVESSVVPADAEGRLALCPMESEEYRAGLEDGAVTVLKALRSSRR